MARFSRSTIQQLAGFDGQIIAEELYYGVDDYWNITITDGTTTDSPYDLTNWSFKLRLIRRSVDDIVDTRNNGIDLINLQPVPGVSEMNLDTNVKVINSSQGMVRLLINDDFFSQVQPVLDAKNPPVYTGYFGAELPATGTVGQPNYIPPQQKKVLLLFIVRSDGISAQTTI